MARRLTKTEFERKKAGILARLRAEAVAFADDSEGGKRQRKEAGLKDKAAFLRDYFPHYFDKPFAQMHYEVIALSYVKNRAVFIAMPREYGKSSIVTMGLIIWDIVYRQKHFILIISDTEEQAADFNEFIKLELEENQRLKQDFGQLIKGIVETKDFVTTNGVRIKARGRKQKVRGLRNRQWRPDKAVVDDAEDDENVRNPKRVKQLIDWLRTAVMGSLGKDWTLMMVGNILKRDCALAQLIKEEDEEGKPRYISRIYKARVDGQSTWPEQWPEARLAAKEHQMSRRAFAREMQNEPRDDENPFQEEWIRYFHPNELEGKVFATIVGFIDPSAGETKRHDYKAIIIVGRDEEGRNWVLDAWIRRASNDDMIEAAYDAYGDWRPNRIGLESNAFQSLYVDLFNERAKEKGYHLPITEVVHTTNKAARIESLDLPVQKGRIWFRKGHPGVALLVDQLLDFPDGPHDDGPDCLEGAVKLAERAGPVEYQSAGTRESVRTFASY